MLFSGWNKKTKADCECMRGAFSGRFLADLASHYTTGPSGFLLLILFSLFPLFLPLVLRTPPEHPTVGESRLAESIGYEAKNARHMSTERLVLLPLSCSILCICHLLTVSLFKLARAANTPFLT